MLSLATHKVIAGSVIPYPLQWQRSHCLWLILFFIHRVVTGKDTKTINGHTFQGFGSHHNNYPVPYFTVAAAVGIKQSDVDTFCVRMDKVLAKVYSSKSKKS